MKPPGYNEALELVFRAFRAFFDSSLFEGIFSPGVFYSFCRDNAEFAEIDKDFRYKWDIDLRNLCSEFCVMYKESSPPNTKDRSAKDTAASMIELAKTHRKTMPHQSLVEFIARETGKKKTVANASLHRSIGRDNINYLVTIDFDSKQLPNFSRDDLKSFLTFLREHKYRSVDDFKGHIRDSITKRLAFDFQQELMPAKKAGWIYLFPSETDGNRVLVKGGSSERDPADRLDEHVLSSLMPMKSWAFVLKSDDVAKHEKQLLDILLDNGEILYGTRECFWVPNGSEVTLWFQFVEETKSNKELEPTG